MHYEELQIADPSFNTHEQLQIFESRTEKGLFPLEKICKPFVCRGTTSFYNQKLQLLPVGESKMWNVSM